MIGLTFLLLAAAVGYGASRWTGLPAIPLLIAGGVGASTLIALEMSFLGDVLTLGVIVLVFVAGIELNPARLRGRGWAALRVGLFQFLALGSLGLACTFLLGFDLQAAAYLALALSASSTLVVVKLLQERQMLFEPVGRLLTGVLLLQDLLIILLIPVVNRLPEGWGAIAEGVLATFALMALTGVLVRWVTPRVLERFDFDEESLLLITLSVLFGFLGIANLLGIPLVSGAFLAGVVLSGFPAAALVRGQLNSMGDFFHALFFTALGAFLPLPTMGEVGLALALLLLVVVVTPPLVAFVAERSGFSARAAVLSGLLLSQTSEFSLVVALQGVLVGHLDSSPFTVITLVTVATMILTPFLASDRVVWKLLARHPLRRSPELHRRPDGHILLLGCGRHGQALLEALIVTREDLVVVDDDPAVVDRLRDAGVTALRGDISDTDLLRAVGADRARVVISTIRRIEDNAPLLDLARDVFVMVRGFNLEDGRWISERGGQPVLYSEAAAHDFRDWYEHEWQADARE
ncbi:MAG: cation:proton antiporter [Gemmatimonadota bacterium]